MIDELAMTFYIFSWGLKLLLLAFIVVGPLNKIKEGRK